MGPPSVISTLTALIQESLMWISYKIVAEFEIKIVYSHLFNDYFTDRV
jgi:hypothetical protein